jgi:hypothetical protein
MEGRRPDEEGEGGGEAPENDVRRIKLEGETLEWRDVRVGVMFEWREAAAAAKRLLLLQNTTRLLGRHGASELLTMKASEVL